MVVAQDTGFRIYRGVLAAHSPIFGDMFTMSQPTDAELLDGCPVVRISDSSHDFRAFLSVLFNFNNDYSKHDHCIDFSLLAAITRLAHKYQVKDLLKDAVNRLERLFPITYEDFMETFRDVRFDRGRHAIEAVNLARLIGDDFILPSILYHCAQLDALTVIRGQTRPDGTVETLSSKDLEICLRGRDALIQTKTIIFTKALTLDQGARFRDGCEDEECCRHVMAYTAEEMATNSGGFSITTFGLFDRRFKEWAMDRVLAPTSGLCHYCCSFMTRTYEEECEKAWARLPALLQIEANWPTGYSDEE